MTGTAVETKLLKWLRQYDAIGPEVSEPGSIRRLDLSHKEIEALPDDFGLLDGLVALNLSNNQLCTLPESMADLKELSMLDLRRNRFETLPSLLSMLPLRSLNGSSNKLKAAPCLRECSDLRVLDISNNALTDISNCLPQNNVLRTLNLECNYITSVTSAYAHMASVERLNLSGNLISAIPSEMLHCESLEVLEISDNRIASIDAAFFSLEVETVDLSSNQLTALVLHGLGSLESLTLDNNPFASLTITDDFAPYLRLFSCDGCGLDRFLLPPSQFLEAICYSANAITVVPEAIGKYAKLAELDLEDNAITELPHALANMLALQTLYILDNPLSDAAKKIIDIKHPDICDLTMKRDVTIEKAALDDLPQMAALLEHLFKLEADFVFDYEKQLAGMTRLFQHEGVDLLVARHEEKVVGMVTMQRLISSAAGDYIGQIEDLVVLDDYRKSGVGSRLINKMRFIAQGCGYKRIQLSADIDNGYALHFYARRGFSRTHLTVFHFKNS